MPPSRSWVPAYVAIGLSWGTSFLFIKWALESIGPVAIAFTRCLLGALTLLAVARARRQALPRGRVVWFHLTVVALCINAVPGMLFPLAEQHVTSILAGLLNALTPLTSLAFIGLVFRDEPVHRRQLLALSVGLIGVLVVLGVWRGLGRAPGMSVAELVGAVTLYGVSFPYTRRHLAGRRESPEALAAGQLVAATLVLLPFLLVAPGTLRPLTAHSISALLVLGVLSSGLAFVWNLRVIAAAGSSLASTTTYITPVVAVVAGVVVLHEPLTWNEPVGGLVVLAGALLGRRGSAARRSATASLTS